MKKLLAALALTATAITSHAAPFVAVDVYDPSAQFFSFWDPLTFQHNILDDGYSIGDTIEGATLTFDFTNDVADFRFDFGLSHENVTAWYDGVTWNLGEVDNGEYVLAIANLSLLADGLLNVTLRTAINNTGAWLDSSTLTVWGEKAAQAEVPEPGTLALLGLGLAGLGVARRRSH